MHSRRLQIRVFSYMAQHALGHYQHLYPFVDAQVLMEEAGAAFDLADTATEVGDHQ